MKYGLKYIPSVGRLNSMMESFYRNIRKVNLSQVQRVEMTFDPFAGKQAESLRLFAFHVDTQKIRQTNAKCTMKLNIVCDRTDPNIKVTLTNGDKALFKTANLSPKEVAEEFNTLCKLYEQKAAAEEQKKRRR